MKSSTTMNTTPSDKALAALAVLQSRFRGEDLKPVCEFDNWLLVRGEEHKGADFSVMKIPFTTTFAYPAFDPDTGFFTLSQNNRTDHPEPPEHVKQFFTGIIKLLLP